MAEYIERAKAKEELLSWARCIKHPEHIMTEDAMCVLDSIPAADVVEVVHGLWEWREEWETHPETHSCDLISCGWYCTECGIELGDYLTKKIGQHIILDDDFRKPKLTRCPNCGARMDGE